MDLTPPSKTAKSLHRRRLRQPGQTKDRTVPALIASIVRFTPGDTVWTPPDEEHWHGAGSDCMMSHLAMLEGTEDGDGTTWLEPVTDEQCQAANA